MVSCSPRNASAASQCHLPVVQAAIEAAALDEFSMAAPETRRRLFSCAVIRVRAARSMQRMLCAKAQSVCGVDHFAGRQVELCPSPGCIPRFGESLPKQVGWTAWIGMPDGQPWTKLVGDPSWSPGLTLHCSRPWIRCRGAKRKVLGSYTATGEAADAQAFGCRFDFRWKHCFCAAWHHDVESSAVTSSTGF